MNEYTLHLSEDLLSAVQQTAQKMRMSTHQFLLAAIRDKLSVTSSLEEIEKYSNEQQSQSMLENIPNQDEAHWGSFLRIACSLSVEGPPDWSEHLDDYLYRNKVIDDEQ